jgi:hypothetical protein
MRIITHINVDLDAVASVWAAQKFIPKACAACIEFRPANWDGTGMEDGDLALDIDAGGRGIKGKKSVGGTVHSCFASIVEQHAPQEDQNVLRDLVRFVDLQDTRGSVVDTLLPNEHSGVKSVFARTCIGYVLRALQVEHKNDTLVIERMSEIFSGMLTIGRARSQAKQEAEEAEILQGGDVAITLQAKEYATTSILFRQHGVRAIVYVDGDSVGVIRDNKEAVRMDHPDILEVVAAANELDEWFAHSAGFLFCRGSRKAPATSPSKVNTHELAEAVAKVLAQHPRV